MPSSLHKTNGNTVLYALHEHDIHMHMFTPAMRDAFANVYFCAAGRCAALGTWRTPPPLVVEPAELLCPLLH